MRRPPAKRLVPASLALLGLMVLAGCTATPDPEPPPAESDVETSAPAPEPAAPALVPDGTADDNLPYFSEIVNATWAGPEPTSGRAYIDALTAAGFDRAAMQVTRDESTVGNPAESIQFSVRWGDQCLVGQVGPATGQPVAVVLPGLGEGRCLVGATRPIDW